MPYPNYILDPTAPGAGEDFTTMVGAENGMQEILTEPITRNITITGTKT